MPCVCPLPPSPPPPRFLPAQTCHYQATIQTNLTCGVPATGSAYRALPQISTQCGGNIYDLSTIAAQDLTYTSPSSPTLIYALRLCGSISTTTATVCSASTACAYNATNPRTSNIGGQVNYTSYTPYQIPTVYQVLGSGAGASVSQLIQDGATCPTAGDTNTERMTNITIVCNTAATTPYISAVTEAVPCHTTFVVQSAAVCTQTPFAMAAYPPVTASCVYGPYNLTSLSQYTFQLNSNYQWAVRPCGVIADVGYCAGQFCQGGTTIAYYNVSASGAPVNDYGSTGTDNYPTWAEVTVNGQQGVANIIQDGTSCGGTSVGSRQGAIYYLCNPNATQAYLSSVTETSPSGVSTSMPHQPPHASRSHHCGVSSVSPSSAAAVLCPAAP